MDYSLNLSTITFGKDDASIESKQGFLGKVFLKTSFYERIRKGEKFLVTGRKGIGKTAICISLQNSLEKENQKGVYITSKDLSLSKIKQIESTAVNDYEKYENIWKYVFFVKICKEIISYDISKVNKSKINRSKNKLKKFLYVNDELNKNLCQKFKTILNSITRITINIFGIEAGYEKIKNLDYDLNDTIDECETNIYEALKEIKDFKLTILADEIDNIWNSKHESKPLIIGLLNAIRKINSYFNPNIIIIVFIRSDIWETLSFADKDKFRTEEEKIDWTNDELKRLIAIRAKVSANIKNLEDNKIDTIWEIFFDKKINNEDSFKYMIKRTFKRPREIIQLCNLALSIAQDNNDYLIREKYILQAESKYSNWKLDDLINEFKIQYPYLRSLLGIFQGFSNSFTKDEIIPRYNKVVKILKIQFEEVNNLYLDSFLQLLFNIGFIGIETDRNILFYYEHPNLPKIILENLKDLKSYVIHPAFLPSLGLKNFKESVFGITIKQDIQISHDDTANINQIGIIGNNIGVIKDDLYDIEEEYINISKEIKKILESLSNEYPTKSYTEKIFIVEKAIEIIENKPQLKNKIINSLRIGLIRALKLTLKHPVASIFIVFIEDWEWKE